LKARIAGLGRGLLLRNTETASLSVLAIATRLPAGLEPFYGSRSPTGLQVFFRLRPAPMDSDAHAH
jgi:hypothetical protein